MGGVGWKDAGVSPYDKLVEAVTALLVAEGFEGVSVRKVATRAGVSVGAVQHHFPTKDAMLAAAMEAASQDFQNRLGERVQPGATAAEALHAVCQELLALGPERRTAGVVWLARVARASVDAGVARQHAAEWGQVEDLLTQLLTAIRTDLDPEQVAQDAAELLALLDGLATAALVEPDRMPAERAYALLARTLDRLTTVST